MFYVLSVFQDRLVLTFAHKLSTGHVKTLYFYGDKSIYFYGDCLASVKYTSRATITCDLKTGLNQSYLATSFFSRSKVFGDI